MNIDFANHAGFSAYVLLLMLSGCVMLVVGSPAVKHQRPLNRVLNVVFGLGFFGYGCYLAFLSHGGTYVIFFQAFILPALLVARTIRSSRGTRPAVPATYPQSAGERYAPRPQQQEANQWAAPQGPVPNPWAAPQGPVPDPWSAPTVAAQTDGYSPSHSAVEPPSHD